MSLFGQTTSSFSLLTRSLFRPQSLLLTPTIPSCCVITSPTSNLKGTPLSYNALSLWTHIVFFKLIWHLAMPGFLLIVFYGCVPMGPFPCVHGSSLVFKHCSLIQYQATPFVLGELLLLWLLVYHQTVSKLWGSGPVIPSVSIFKKSGPHACSCV
jgi:hypothetical protein